ncbi:hypothetical protein Tco_1092415 [Tanacetum coccineum]|uniref:Retrotransposon gag domain-containing protein n=1 Tax=Tanacetum coccineum TaxID=301880 RepID=A0ABQ5IBS7_9ASTR
MGDENPIRTLGDYSKPSHKGYRNTIELPEGNNVVPLRSDTICTCTFQGSKNEDPLHHVKHYLSIVDNIQADGATRDTSRLRFFHFSLTGKAAEWLDRISLTQITTWGQIVPHHGIQKWLLVQIFHDNISQIDRRKLDQFTQFRFSSLTEEEGWNRIEEYV